MSFSSRTNRQQDHMREKLQKQQTKKDASKKTDNGNKK